MTSLHRSKLFRLLASSVVALAVPSPGGAQTTRLPDWTGQWHAVESVRLFETVAGGTSTHNDPRTRDHPPYKPEWEARYVAALPKATRQGSANPDMLLDSYTRYCAAGVPRLMASPFTLEFAISPEQTWIVAYASEVRHIYTDPKYKVSDDVLATSPWGYSYGRWDKSTLKIDTVSLQPDLWLDTTPLLLSEKASVHEEIRRVSADLIEDQITITDPDAFTAPWKVVRHYARVKNFIPAGEDTCKGQSHDPTGARQPG